MEETKVTLPPPKPGDYMEITAGSEGAKVQKSNLEEVRRLIDSRPISFPCSMPDLKIEFAMRILESFNSRREPASSDGCELYESAVLVLKEYLKPGPKEGERQ